MFISRTFFINCFIPGIDDSYNWLILYCAFIDNSCNYLFNSRSYTRKLFDSSDICFNSYSQYSINPLKFYTFYDPIFDNLSLFDCCMLLIVFIIVSCDFKICKFVNNPILLRLLYIISFDKNGPLFLPKNYKVFYPNLTHKMHLVSIRYYFPSNYLSILILLTFLFL